MEKFGDQGKGEQQFRGIAECWCSPRSGCGSVFVRRLSRGQRAEGFEGRGVYTFRPDHFRCSGQRRRRWSTAFIFATVTDGEDFELIERPKESLTPWPRFCLWRKLIASNAPPKPMPLRRPRRFVRRLWKVMRVVLVPQSAESRGKRTILATWRIPGSWWLQFRVPLQAPTPPLPENPKEVRLGRLRVLRRPLSWLG